jgi:hypothetical protein
MTSVSAIFNGSFVNIVSVNGDSSSLNIVYVDAAKNLKVSKAFMDNSGNVTLGISATII